MTRAPYWAPRGKEMGTDPRKGHGVWGPRSPRPHPFCGFLVGHQLLRFGESFPGTSSPVAVRCLQGVLLKRVSGAPRFLPCPGVYHPKGPGSSVSSGDPSRALSFVRAPPRAVPPVSGAANSWAAESQGPALGRTRGPVSPRVPAPSGGTADHTRVCPPSAS